MTLEQQMELSRERAGEAIQNRDKKMAEKEINNFIRLGITLLELDRISEESNTDVDDCYYDSFCF